MVVVDRDEKAARDAFNVSVDGGLTFFDTAEIYGSNVCAYPLLFSSFPFNKVSMLMLVRKEVKLLFPPAAHARSSKFRSSSWKVFKTYLTNLMIIFMLVILHSINKDIWKKLTKLELSHIY